MTEWMVRAAVAGGLVGLGGLAVERLLRDRRRPARAVWVVSLVVSIVLPMLALAAPKWPAAQLAVRFDFGDLAPTAAAPGPGAWAGNEISKAQPNLVLWFWLLASGFLLLRYGWAWWHVHRVMAGTRAAHVAGAAVWLSCGLGPAVVGVIRPRIVIPRWLLALPEDRKRMVIRHEREHLRGGDHWLLGLAPLLAVAFPWNASIWWQLRRLRRAVELDCDARVLRAGAPAQVYATLLLDVAQQRAATGLLALSHKGSLVKERVQALLSAARPVRRAHSTGLVALSALLALAGFVAVLPDRTVLAQRLAQSESRTPAAIPLVVIDGQVAPPNQMVDVLVDRIVDIEALESDAAQARFGSAARAGAIVISTVGRSGGSELLARGRAATGNAIDVTVRLRKPGSFAPLAGLVEVRRLGTEGMELGRLPWFDPKDVLSIQVVKGNAALLRYGERAARLGMIMLTLRGNYFDGIRIAERR